MDRFHPKTLLDKTYEIGLLLKGINGTLEIIGGVLILVLSDNAVNNIVHSLTGKNIHEHSTNLFAQQIIHIGDDLVNGHNWFAVTFLLTHGIVKVTLVVCLLLNKIWAFPWAIGALSLFLVVQIYQLVTKPSFFMVALTVIDVFIIWLVNREWSVVKAEAVRQSTPQ